MSFHYSSYWHNWSRVLSTNHEHGPFVEVNLTPIGGRTGWSSEIDRIRGVNIRFHGTARDNKDIITDILPDEVYDEMMIHLGEDLTRRLLTEDFLPQIDYELYRKYSNGGCALDKCTRK